MFFTNHMRVLALVVKDPDLRLRQIADEVGITERAAHRIVSELVDSGYLARERTGARNRYTLLRPPPVDPATSTIIRQAVRQGSQNGHGPSTPNAPRIFPGVFDAIPAGVAISDETGAILAVNHEFCSVVGRTEEELRGRCFRDITHPDDVAADEEGRSRLLAGARAGHDGERRYIRPDGTVIWVRVRAVPAVDPESGDRVLVAHVTEIGDRRRQERELAEAEERFRSAFDNAPIGMALVAPDGRWLKVNRAICRITGYSETALLTRDFQSITHRDDLEADLGYVRQLLDGEIDSYQMDKRYHHANGHIIWVSLSVSLVRGGTGEPLYFIAQVEDITHRRAVEKSMRRTADRIAEAISIIDSDGNHLHVNGAAQSILSGLRESFERGPVGDLDWRAIAEDGTPVSPELFPAEITRLTGREIDEAILGFPTASEEIRWLRISTRRLSDGGPPYQVIVSFTDISRRKQAERALALSQARLDALFRYIPAALSLRDLDGHYLNVTDSVARAVGRTPEDMVGRHPSEHLGGEALAATLADDEAIRSNGGTITREVRIQHADGTEHDYYVLKWPVLDEAGAVAAFGAFSLDLSERRQD